MKTALLGALILAAGVWLALEARDDQEAPAATAAAGFRFRWPAGQEYVYDLSWRSDHQARLPLGEGGAEESMEVHSDLVGTLTLRSLGARGEHVFLELGLGELTRHEVRIGERDLAAAAAVLSEPRAVLEVAPSGAVVRMHFDPATPPLYRQVVSGLLTSLHVERGPAGAARWQVGAPGPAGRSDLELAFTGAHELARRRLRYHDRETQDTRGLAEVTLDPAGHLRSLRDEEHASLDAGALPAVEAHVVTRLELRRLGRFQPPASLPALLAGRESLAPGEVRRSEAVERQLLDQRVDGLTHQAFLADLAVHANGGRLPDHNRWLWRATGLLQRDPELAARLVPIFASGKLQPTGQELLMDLLALAGTPATQAAMREVLRLPAIRGERGPFIELVQRFSLVERIDAESATFLRELYGEASRGRDDGRLGSSAFALGASAGRLREQGQDAAARAAAGQLVRDLASAGSPERRGILLGALGNAGMDEHLDVIVPFAADGDAGVRASAAYALRDLHEPRSRRTLLGLIEDRESAVQGAALTALASHTLAGADLEPIAAAMDAGRLDRAHDPAVLGLVAARLDQPVARRILELVIHRHPDDAALRARARALLGGA